jgi:hypothetical protein
MTKPQISTLSRIEKSRIALIAEQIRAATAWLEKRHNYTPAQLRNLTGGGQRDGTDVRAHECLHPNSITRIKHLRLSWTAMEYNPTTKRNVWREVPEQVAGGGAATLQWMWNPQLDTFEKLERILSEAIRLGFNLGFKLNADPLAAEPVSAPVKTALRPRVLAKRKLIHEPALGQTKHPVPVGAKKKPAKRKKAAKPAKTVKPSRARPPTQRAA